MSVKSLFDEDGKYGMLSSSVTKSVVVSMISSVVVGEVVVVVVVVVVVDGVDLIVVELTFEVVRSSISSDFTCLFG